MVETIIGVIVIIMIVVVGISVSQINRNIKKLIAIQSELLKRTPMPVSKNVDKFDPQTGNPL